MFLWSENRVKPSRGRCQISKLEIQRNPYHALIMIFYILYQWKLEKTWLTTSPKQIITKTHKTSFSRFFRLNIWIKRTRGRYEVSKLENKRSSYHALIVIFYLQKHWKLEITWLTKSPGQIITKTNKTRLLCFFGLKT